MDVSHILEPIVSNVIIVKNNDGEAYIADWAFNGIGEFLIGQGYQVKTSSQSNFHMQGDFTSSELYPTLLKEGWNIIGYLKLEAVSAEIILTDLVEQEMQEDTPLELQMLCEWQGQYGHLNIHIHGQYFDDVEGDHTLSVLIEESYRIGDQLYYGNDPEHVTDYEFNHLLRGSVTGPQGLVVTSDATNGEHFQSDFSFEWNNDWILDNCTVLAVVSDEDGYIVNCLGYHITN